MIKNVRGQKVDTVFVLIVFLVFAVSVLMVLLLGATTYGSITDMSREGHDESTILSYIWTKVKNSDDSGAITVVDFHGKPTLSIGEEIGGIIYHTLVYHYDGWVYELFSEVSLEFNPEDGVRIIESSELMFEELDYGLIKVSSGNRSLLLFPRGNAPDLHLHDFYAEEVIIG